MAEERNLWIRLGAMLRITVEEEAAIFCGDPAQAYAALSFKAIPTYTALAVFYLVILSVLIIAQKQIERKMHA